MTGVCCGQQQQVSDRRLTGRRWALRRSAIGTAQALLRHGLGEGLVRNRCAGGVCEALARHCAGQ